MIWLVFLICSSLILCNKKYVYSIFLIASMWINFDVRCGFLSFITMLSGVIILYGFMTRKKTLTFRSDIDSLIYKFLIYCVLIYIPFIILSTELDVFYQLNSLKSQFVNVILLLILWQWKENNIFSYRKETKYIALSVCILCIYGIFTYVLRSNPYMEYMSAYCTNEDLVDLIDKSMDDARGNLHGRITGTSLYTIQYAIMLIIYVYIYWILKPLQKQKTFLIVLILIISNIYLTGSRGPLVALFVGIILYLMRSLSLRKQITYISIITIFLLCAWSYVEPMFSLFLDDDIKGSSTEGRAEQLAGALMLVAGSQRSFLFGLGSGYTTYYTSNFGPHPLALYFESTHISSLVNVGLLGFLFIFVGELLFLFYIICQTYKKNLINKSSFCLLSSFLLSNFIYCIMVGNVYGSLFIAAFLLCIKLSMFQHSSMIKRKI